MKKVKIGLIGLGFMGTTHYRIYENLPNAEVVAIADVDGAKRSGDISKVIGNIGNSDNSIPFDLSSVNTYEDALEMIANEDLDMIDICVPTVKHKEYIVAGLKASLHVFCEKPLCRNLDDLKEIEAAVKASDKFLNIGMCLRAWSEYMHAQETIESGRLGRVLTAHFRRLSPNIDGNAWNNWFMQDELSGGAILDMHLHDTDIIYKMFGAPKSVTSFGIKGAVSDNAIDHVMTNYEYDNMLISAEGGWVAAKNVPFEMSFQIVCEKGTMKMDSTGYHIYLNDSIETPDVIVEEYPTGWHRELDYFVNSILNNTRPDKYQTPESIFAAYKLLWAEIESVNSGKKVEI